MRAVGRLLKTTYVLTQTFLRDPIGGYGLGLQFTNCIAACSKLADRTGVCGRRSPTIGHSWRADARIGGYIADQHAEFDENSTSIDGYRSAD